METIVGFLSRPHGFNVLSTIGKLDGFKILKIYTHKFNPKSQDPNRNIRDDFELFVNKCKELSIPLETIDSKDSIIKNCPECDYIIEVSWRYIIPSNIVKKSRIGTFGIHRGKLPEYGGAEPIKQAMKNNKITEELSPEHETITHILCNCYICPNFIHLHKTAILKV